MQCRGRAISALAPFALALLFKERPLVAIAARISHPGESELSQEVTVNTEGRAGANNAIRMATIRQTGNFEDFVEFNVCGDNSSASAAGGAHLAQAAVRFCEDKTLAGLMQSWMPKSFLETYNNFYDNEGWTDEALMTLFYMEVKGGGPVKLADIANHTQFKLVEHWVNAAGIASGLKRPTLVYHVGTLDESAKVADLLKPEAHPNLVLMNVAPYMPGSRFAKKGKHSHKFHATLVTRARSVVYLDLDDIPIPLPGRMDTLFKRIPEESNSEYPYGILQSHWMSRDPRSDPGVTGYHHYDWHCAECGPQLARWAQGNMLAFGAAAVPFFAKVLLDYVLNVGPKQTWNTPQDEPALNVHLWQANATKQWCRLDIPFPKRGKQGSALFKSLEMDVQTHAYPDSFWYPRGLPRSLLAVHNVKDPDQAKDIVALYGAGGIMSKEWGHRPATWMFDGQEMSREEVEARFPDLKCMVF